MLKKIVFFFCILPVNFSILAEELETSDVVVQDDSDEFGDLELLDMIETEYCTLSEEGDIKTGIVTLKSIEDRGFDGGKYNRESIENEALGSALADKFKITITDDMITKMLKGKNMGNVDLESLVENRQFPFASVQSLYDELKIINASREAKSYEAHSMIGEAVQEYYEAHPEYEETSYDLEIGFTPFDKNKSNQELKDELESGIKKQNLEKFNLTWFPAPIKQSEIPESRKFIKEMSIGSMVLKDAPDGFDIYRLKKIKLQRLKGLQERYWEIANVVAPDIENKIIEKWRSNAIIFHPDEIYPIPFNSYELEG